MLSVPIWNVIEFGVSLKGVDVLIGMDVIRICRLLVDGPAGVFSLDW